MVQGGGGLGVTSSSWRGGEVGVGGRGLGKFFRDEKKVAFFLAGVCRGGE